MIKKKKHSFTPYILMTCITVGGVVWVGNQSNAETWEKPIDIIQEVATPKKSVEDVTKELRGEVLDAIAECESGNSTSSRSDGLIIFDSNNEASIGRYMYQRKTVQGYYKLFYNQEISASEAIAISIDRDKARALAEKIIFEDEGKGVDNWYNCAIKKNVKPKIEIIKRLEKEI